MSREQKNIADVQFIYESVVAFHNRSHREIADYLKTHRDELHTTIPLRSGGVLFCGRPAYERFEELARRTLKPGSPAARDFAFDEYVHSLRRAFGEMFLERTARIDQSSVTRFLTLANRIASASLVERTYHISCELFSENVPDAFQCGPILFETRRLFLARKAEALETYLRESRDAFAGGLAKREPHLDESEIRSQSDDFARRHEEGIRDYYSESDWVATVAVSACHSSISRERAERATDSALDVLRLFTVFAPERLRRASSVNPARTYELVSDGDSISSEMFVAGRNGMAGEGWSDAILQRAPEIWQELTNAIAAITSGTKPTELDQRLVDALNWFGQAVRETNPAAAIVKYSAALERLTITGHLQGIERAVIQRTLILNQSRTDKTEEQIQSDIGKFYQCRSDLMHGSLSPDDPSVRQMRRLGWELTRWSIMEASRLYRLLREVGKATRNGLAAAYQGGRRRNDGSLLPGA